MNQKVWYNNQSVINFTMDCVAKWNIAPANFNIFHLAFIYFQLKLTKMGLVRKYTYIHITTFIRPCGSVVGIGINIQRNVKKTQIANIQCHWPSFTETCWISKAPKLNFKFSKFSKFFEPSNSLTNYFDWWTLWSTWVW